MPDEPKAYMMIIITNYTKDQLNALAVESINYTHSKVQEYFDYIRMLGWWIPFGSNAQWSVWKHWAEQYDGWTP